MHFLYQSNCSMSASYGNTTIGISQNYIGLPTAHFEEQYLYLL